MEKRDKVIEDMGNVAMRQYEMELDLRDLAAGQKIQKRKMDNITTLLYINLFLTVATLTAVWMR
jgi:hypothetical protein